MKWLNCVWSDICVYEMTYLCMKWHICVWNDLSVYEVTHLGMKWLMCVWNDLPVYEVTYMCMKWLICVWSDPPGYEVTYVCMKWLTCVWSVCTCSSSMAFSSLSNLWIWFDLILWKVRPWHVRKCQFIVILFVLSWLYIIRIYIFFIFWHIPYFSKIWPGR